MPLRGGAVRVAVRPWDMAPDPDGLIPAGSEPDRVVLRLPADAACAPVARTCVMALGLRAGFAWSVLTDLALGVDEALVLLVGHASNHPPGANGTVELRCHVTDGALEVTVELLGGVGRPAAEAIERCRTLVTGAVSQASVRADGLAVAFSVTTWAG